MSFFANCFVPIMKRIGENFELFEIFVHLSLKKIGFLQLFTFTAHQKNVTFRCPGRKTK
jgi:hypothetical protein